MTLPLRLEARSVDAFAADVRRAEALGWEAAFQPDSQLRRRDTYVLMAAAARVTERIVLATGIAAGGPRTLRMAGGVADGVFIRVGTHAATLKKSIDEIHAGAAPA